MSEHLIIPARYAKLIIKQIKAAEGRESMDKDQWNVSADDLIPLLPLEEIAKVKEVILEDMRAKVPGSTRVYKAFTSLERRRQTFDHLSKAKSGTFDPTQIQIYSLADLASALKDAIEHTSKKRWLFVNLKGAAMVPMFVNDIKYYPEGHNRRENVIISAIAISGCEEPTFCAETFTLHDDCLGGDEGFASLDDDGEDDGETSVRNTTRKRKKIGSSLADVIGREDFYLSTPPMEANYLKLHAAYKKLADRCGDQYVAVNDAAMGIDVTDSYVTSLQNLTIDGTPARLVLDDVAAEDYSSDFSRATGFDIKEKMSEIGEFWELKTPVLPTLPFVRVFNLQSNEHMFVAADAVQPYVYDANLWDKLVLPESDLDFIRMLMSSIEINITDIIQGKARGIIVICSGDPGLGKTLTAEVSAEAFKKPLYSVQCSQLGIDPDTLEKNLLKCLARATRWGAILLLDEADVYVQRRGNDIHQNAIVGVFLRVLEYYKGILFATTNREGDIDDAIESRGTAHLRYKLPTVELLPRLWEVLSKQLTVELTKDEITELCTMFGPIPPRSIRNLLKLTKYHAVAQKRKATVSMVRKVSAYLNVLVPDTKN